MPTAAAGGNMRATMAWTCAVRSRSWTSHRSAPWTSSAVLRAASA